MTRTRSAPPGLWLAQVFVAVLLILFAARFAVSLAKAPVAAERRAGRRTSAAPRPPGDLGADLSPELGQVRPKPEASPDPLRAGSSPKPFRGSEPNSGYAADHYRTELLRDEESYQLWSLDSRELTWFFANKRRILTSDIETRSEPAGGLRVLRIREGSFGSSRGLRVGDILRDINGQSLDDSFDLEDLIEDPAYSGSKGWRVALERDGKPLTIDYRPASSTVTTHREH
jgi:hypothetical protein